MVSADVKALIDRGDAALGKVPAAVSTAVSAATTAALQSVDKNRQDDMQATSDFMDRVEQTVGGIAGSTGGSSGGPAPAGGTGGPAGTGAPADSTTELSDDDTAAFAAAQANGFTGSADAWLAAGKPTGATPTLDEQ